MKIIILLSIVLLSVVSIFTISTSDVYGNAPEVPRNPTESCMIIWNAATQHHEHPCVSHIVWNGYGITGNVKSFYSDFVDMVRFEIHVVAPGFVEFKNFLKDQKGFGDTYEACQSMPHPPFRSTCWLVKVADDGWITIPYKMEITDDSGDFILMLERQPPTVEERFNAIFQKMYDFMTKSIKEQIEQIAIQNKIDNGPNCIEIYPACIWYSMSGGATVISGEKESDKLFNLTIDTNDGPGILWIKPYHYFVDDPPWYYVVTTESGEIQKTGSVEERSQRKSMQYMAIPFSIDSKFVEVGVGSTP